MLSREVQHYLHEINRVIKPEGRAMVTFFVLDELAKKAVAEKKATANLVYAFDEHSYYSHKNVPEAEIGFLQEWIEAAVSRAGLRIEKILYGSWSGRPNPLSYQDILVLRKK